MPTLSSQHVHFGGALLSWLLSVISITVGHEPHVHSFLLPAGNGYLHALWVFTVVVQGIYLFEFFGSSSQEIKQHFVLNNILLFAWYWSFKKTAEIVPFLFGLALLVSGYSLYYRGRSWTTSAVREWLGVHVPVVSVPIVWGLYLTFAHGWSVFNLPHKIFGLHSEIIAVVAWFLIGVALLLTYADWATGILLGYFALSIAGSSHKHGIDSVAGAGGVVLVALSIYLAYKRPSSLHLDREQAPLLG